MKDQAYKLREIVKEHEQKQIAHLSKKQIARPKIISFCSGKGGVGKTSLAVNLSILLAKENINVLLFDADLGLSNVNVLFGLYGKSLGIDAVISGEKKLKDVIYHTQYGVDIISGGNGNNNLVNMTQSEIWYFFEKLLSFIQYDMIILDTGAGISKNVTSFLYVSDEIILVTTPEKTSITDAYGMIKVVSGSGHDVSLNLVVNRCQNLKDGFSTMNRLEQVSLKYLKQPINQLGVIYYDEKIVQLFNDKNEPYIVHENNSKSALSINSLCHKIIKWLK